MKKYGNNDTEIWMRTAINYPYFCWTNAFSSHLCDLIVDEGLKLGAKDASLDDGGIINKDIRKGLVSFFPDDYWLEYTLIEYVKKASIQAGWNFVIDNKEQLQFANYRKEAHYDWHRDCDIQSDVYRKLSVTVQLSDPEDYQGGVLEFKNYWGTTPIVTPENVLAKGSIIVFPSAMLHRVTPVTKGERFSLVQWYSGPDFV